MSKSTEAMEQNIPNPGPGAGHDAIAVAGRIAAELAKTAAERDQQGGTPQRERELLRASKLLGLIIPRSSAAGAPVGPTRSRPFG